MAVAYLLHLVEIHSFKLFSISFLLSYYLHCKMIVIIPFEGSFILPLSYRFRALRLWIANKKEPVSPSCAVHAILGSHIHIHAEVIHAARVR